MNKSYVLTRLIENGFGVGIANEFYKAVATDNISPIAKAVVTKSFTKYASVARFNSRAKIDLWWSAYSDLVKWVDEQQIDDYAKSVFISQIIDCLNLDEFTKEAFKREVEDFIKYVSEEN